MALRKPKGDELDRQAREMEEAARKANLNKDQSRSQYRTPVPTQSPKRRTTEAKYGSKAQVTRSTDPRKADIKWDGPSEDYKKRTTANRERWERETTAKQRAHKMAAGRDPDDNRPLGEQMQSVADAQNMQNGYTDYQVDSRGLPYDATRIDPRTGLPKTGPAPAQQQQAGPERRPPRWEKATPETLRAQADERARKQLGIQEPQKPGQQPKRKVTIKIVEGQQTDLKGVKREDLDPATRAKLELTEDQKLRVEQKSYAALRSTEAGNFADAAVFKKSATTDKKLLAGMERDLYQSSAAGSEKWQSNIRQSIQGIDFTQRKAAGLDEERRDTQTARTWAEIAKLKADPAALRTIGTADKKRICDADSLTAQVKNKLGPEAVAALDTGSSPIFGANDLYNKALDARTTAAQQWGTVAYEKPQDLSRGAERDMGRGLERNLTDK